MHTDIGRTREHQNPLLRFQALERLPRRSCHIVSVEVVYLVMADPHTVHIVIKCLIILLVVGQTAYQPLKLKEAVQIQILARRNRY